MRTILRLLDASGPAFIGAVAIDLGFGRTGWALVGAGITCAVICARRIIREHTSRIVEVDEEAAMVLIEFRRHGRTCRRWLPISEVLGTPAAPGGR